MQSDSFSRILHMKEIKTIIWKWFIQKEPNKMYAVDEYATYHINILLYHGMFEVYINYLSYIFLK